MSDYITIFKQYEHIHDFYVGCSSFKWLVLTFLAEYDVNVKAINKNDPYDIYLDKKKEFVTKFRDSYDILKQLYKLIDVSDDIAIKNFNLLLCKKLFKNDEYPAGNFRLHNVRISYIMQRIIDRLYYVLRKVYFNDDPKQWTEYNLKLSIVSVNLYHHVWKFKKLYFDLCEKMLPVIYELYPKTKEIEYRFINPHNNTVHTIKNYT